MDQGMEKIQKLFNTIQEKTDEKWEKKYVELDCKMVEGKEQVDNNDGHMDDNYKGLQEQGNKLINVEAKINQDTEEKIQICKVLKEQSKKIVDDIAEKIKIESQKGFVKNYWGIKEESMMKCELYGIKFNHSLRQLEEELLNKVRIIEDKEFDELVRILEVHYQCERDRVRDDGNKYNNRGRYDNYQHKKYNYGGQGRNNNYYSQGPYQGYQFYHYNKNGNDRSSGRNSSINEIIQQPRENVDTMEGVLENLNQTPSPSINIENETETACDNCGVIDFSTKTDTNEDVILVNDNDDDSEVEILDVPCMSRMTRRRRKMALMPRNNAKKCITSKRNPISNDDEPENFQIQRKSNH
ncbi:hypothetical protein FQA39_LY15276 [Lamprigera yunnana]|nr:hypothetical protein FQA39_LY15276 [Lamprigera yunnana]